MQIENVLRGALGMFFLIFVCWLLSTDRKAINWKLVGFALVAMIGFYLGVTKVFFINAFFDFLSRAFVKMIDVEIESTRLLFSNLVEVRPDSWGFIFAVRVLPTIIFFSALSSILYYTGILQKIVYFFALLLSKLKISGAESVSTAANIFMGQTEAPLMIKPYLDRMNRSEILLVMVGGMANTAGSVLGAYVSFLGGEDPGSKAFFAMHLLTQSILSAPAAIICSKILFPQTLPVVTEIKIPKQKLGDNFLDALSLGTTDGLKLAVNVAAMLLAFTALVFVLNYFLFKVGDWTNLNGLIAANTPYSNLSFQMILGYIFSPVAWLIGVNSEDMLKIGQLLGEKTILNEFNAFVSFGNMKNAGQLTDPKSVLIATYSLAGFANFASIGIQIGGISQLAPNQRKNLTELGVKALIGGTIACLMCGCIAGMFV
ncbi:MAG TPA: nucleoside transporter C-terminal domain-containing protein [Chitinophagaceae bacterium]|nr:nucleoside transporter C-terminal domain-containing protein [Chitinophagaceae bacterium]